MKDPKIASIHQSNVKLNLLKPARPRNGKTGSRAPATSSPLQRCSAFSKASGRLHVQPSRPAPSFILPLPIFLQRAKLHVAEGDKSLGEDTLDGNLVRPSIICSNTGNAEVFADKFP
jgi:hypothetical protein